MSGHLGYSVGMEANTNTPNELRRQVAVTILLDAPADDLGRIVIPGSGEEPPTEARELLEADVWRALEALADHDLYVAAVTARQGQVYEVPALPAEVAEAF